MTTAIVLVMHGIPPSDFPERERGEYFGMSGRIRTASKDDLPMLLERQKFLEEKMRNWPRTAENDPFHAASLELAGHLKEISGEEVRVAFNEFCAPDVEAAINGGIADGADRIVVASTMMTKGGGHAEEEVAHIIEAVQKENPDVAIVYAWPYDSKEVATFINQHISRFNKE